MMLISMMAEVGGSDSGGAKPSPLTASVVLSFAIFMCGASADVTLAGKIGAGKIMHLTILPNRPTTGTVNDLIFVDETTSSNRN
jgi:hypothetical protein